MLSRQLPLNSQIRKSHMKTLAFPIILAVLLSACSSVDPYTKRANQEREMQERYVERAISNAPPWMFKVPSSNSAIYESGTGVSGDFSMAEVKAKTDAYAKICMMLGGAVSQKTKIYRTDSEVNSTELSEMAMKAGCKEVDLTGIEVRDIKRTSEGGRFRTYVLVAMPTGDANILRKAKEAHQQKELAMQRAPEAFKELDKP